MSCHMTPSTSSRPSSHRPPKRLNSQVNKGSTEGISHFSTAEANSGPATSKRLRRSQSSESRPISPGQSAAHPSHTTLDATSRMDRAPFSHRGDSRGRMPRSSGGFGRGGGGRAPSRGRGRDTAPVVDRKQLSLPTLNGPLLDEAHIKATGIDPGLPPVNERWLENPKSTVSNYYSLNFGKQPAYEAMEGVLEGRKLIRCTVLVDSKHMITGVGDAPIRKEAEKLAALSGMLQLHRLGLLEKPKQQPNVPSAGTDANGPKLRDDSVVTYEIARQFMDFYCKEFRYDPPEVTFDKSEKGSRTAWDATMTVGGRRIGLGYASTKKEAKNNCYVDVTVYLDQCDDTLWPRFKEQMAKRGPDGDPGMAAKVHFIMSDDLDEEIRDLCRDVKNSSLYANRPVTQPTQSFTQPEDRPSSRNGIYRPPRPGQDGPTERYHETKSTRLREGREAYENDPKMRHMRETRRSLPVYTRAKDLLATIERNDVTICMAATGSGKTTQVPQLILDEMIERGKGSRCNIICTQPRRIAAISVAERIAKERGEPLGQSIGYQVRFEAKLPQEHGNITFCTTGIFLKRMQSALLERAQGKRHGTGYSLDDVTHILVDEVHERDVDTDLLLVVLKRLLADRRARQKPLKIVLMSATIDPTLFQTYFASEDGTPAPVAEVPGRSFPVTKYYMDDIIQQLSMIEMRDSSWVWGEKSVIEYAEGEIGPHALAAVTGNPSYLPGVHTDMSRILQKDFDIPYPLVALTIAHVIKKSDDGHVLVFLPGWDEMMALQRVLDDRRQSLLRVDLANRNKYSVHLLHSTVPVAEQQAVFDPPSPGVRRIILATNIAETSITIPDVVYVVDTARIKEKRYDPTRHMSSLVSTWVGSSNLNQRAGRAGRHRSGEYYGIISKARLATLDPYQLVEMKRTDLTNVVMHVKAINFPGMEVEEVLAETIEPPEAERVASAMRSLRMVGALDDQKNLTSLGRVLLQLPVEVAVGRLVLYGSFFKCLDQALTLAAILTNRDPFMAPIALKQEANAAKERWSSNDFRSDALATLNAYNTWWAMQDRGEYVSANRFCSENFLSKPSLLNIQRIKGHLLQSLYYAGVLDVSAGGTSSNHRVARDMVVPPELNAHGDSKPLLAALITIACQPNFAIRHKEKMYRTREDKTAFIHPGSVNHRKRQADERVSGTDEEVGAQGTPLSQKEVKELDYLTGDIVRILNRYSEERLSRQDSRWNSRPGTPSGYSTPPYFGPGTIRMSASGASTPNPGFGGYRLGPRSAYFDSRPSTRPSSPHWR
ncbi:hypothetical protein FRC11_004897 [Ceratobasidium sp. 423]|nr:hypothetical protein FRC11_004897 [Ceratobasidium sp. 423]